jgi:uncharacterized protein (DUF2235 family)
VGNSTQNITLLTESPGALAVGLSENIREAYVFLANNYQTTIGGLTDGIYLMGFSRGAFTARSVAGLIVGMSLLTREAMKYFYYVFEVRGKDPL